MQIIIIIILEIHYHLKQQIKVQIKKYFGIQLLALHTIHISKIVFGLINTLTATQGRRPFVAV